MTVPEAIESEAKDRVRLMLKHSPSFLALLGYGALAGNEAAIDARIHYDEIRENLNPENTGSDHGGPALRPLALIHTAKFDYAAASQGQFNEWSAAGGVRLLIESQYLGDQITDGQAQREQFERSVGKIRTELVDLVQDPLGTAYYTAFHTIAATIPVSRTPAKQRTATHDFFAVGWSLEAGNEGGD